MHRLPLLVLQAALIVASSWSHSAEANKTKVTEINDQAELLEDGKAINGSKSEDYKHHGWSGGQTGYGYGGYGNGWHAAEQPVVGTVRTRVTVQKRILKPISKHHHHHHHDPVVVVQQPVDPLGGFEGSYVAVSGRPGERTVHAVNGINSVAIEPAGPAVFLGRGPVLAVDYDDGINGLAGGLPKCSYLDTDFVGSDVGDGRGLTTGSAYACKQACVDENKCQFWTFRAGWARDCYLKRGEGRGDVKPENVTPKAGFVSGTVGNRKCVCLTGNGDRICPTRRSGASGRPWRRKSVGPRFDYEDEEEDDDDRDDNDDDDNDDREVATRDRDDNTTDTTEATSSTRRRNRNRTTAAPGGSTRRRNRNRDRTSNIKNDDGAEKDDDAETL